MVGKALLLIAATAVSLPTIQANEFFKKKHVFQSEFEVFYVTPERMVEFFLPVFENIPGICVLACPIVSFFVIKPTAGEIKNFRPCAIKSQIIP